MPTSFKLTGIPDEILGAVEHECPEIGIILERVREHVPQLKREIATYQAAVLYAMARQYDRANASILEIGTAWGYSAAVMAEAAPKAHIVTLNQPKPAEFERAVKHLAPYRNVLPLQVLSWEYLEALEPDVRFDLVFVDGDHVQVKRDLPWWDRLNSGGLFLFHDYSPDGSGRPCQPVYDGVNHWMAEKNLEPDVLVVDDRQVGIVGFYKLQGRSKSVRE